MMRWWRQAPFLAFALGAGPGLALEGKAVYVQTCAACHTAGVSGAPRLGDRLAWQPRLRAGIDGLLESVLKGKGAMPPKGGNANLSDADARAAVVFMVEAVR